MDIQYRKILNRIDKEELLLIKAEAEFLFDDIEKADNIVTSKANNLFQMLIVFQTSAIAFVVTQNPICFYGMNYLDLITSTFLFFNFISLFFLIRIILLKNTSLKGAQPIEYLREDVFRVDAPNESKENLLAMSIRSIQSHIEKNSSIQKNKANCFKIANALFLFGLITIVIMTICKILYF